MTKPVPDVNFAPLFLAHLRETAQHFADHGGVSIETAIRMARAHLMLTVTSDLEEAVGTAISIETTPVPNGWAVIHG